MKEINPDFVTVEHFLSPFLEFLKWGVRGALPKIFKSGNSHC
jgi:hypothetical protein